MAGTISIGSPQHKAHLEGVKADESAAKKEAKEEKAAEKAAEKTEAKKDK